MTTLDTRGALAIMIIVLLTGGVLGNYLGRKAVGIWLITGAFALGTVWAGLSISWANANPNESMVPADSYLAMTLLALSATLFYGYKAVNGIGLTERL